MTQHEIQFELEGLIQLLARNLYADTDVFLREMLQNAKDSTLKRREVAGERGDVDLPSPRIEVVSRRDDQTLVIRDNGAGLTRDEIHEYLSTIGRSGTRALREQLEQADRGEAVELIGQFGIGLLSAFAVLPATDQMRFRGLQTAGDRVLADDACRVEIAEFEPHELPALIVEPRRRRRRREMEGVVQELGVPSFLENAVGDMLGQEVDPSVLYLNAANETIQALARHAPDGGDLLEAALRALYANASLLSGRRLAETEARQFFSHNTRLLDLLLSGETGGPIS